MLKISYSSGLPREYSIITILISVFIFVSNFLVLLTFQQLKKRTIQHLYMVALVGPDLLLLAIDCTISAILINGGVSISPYLCDVLAIMVSSAIAMTAFVHSALCVDRWVSVRHPIWYRVFKEGRKSRIVTKLIAAACYALPLVSFTIFTYLNLLDTNFDPLIPICVNAKGDSDSGSIGMIIIYLCIGVVMILPVIIQASTGGYIVFRVIRLRGATRARIIKSIRSVFIIVVTYYVCWLPSVSYQFWEMNKRTETPIWLKFIIVQLHMANCGMSLPIYLMTIPDFRAEFFSLMRQVCKRLRTGATRVGHIEDPTQISCVAPARIDQPLPEVY